MRLLLARTSAEAHVYMMLTPCFICWATGYVPPSSGLRKIDGVPHVTYEGTCPACHLPIDFTFRIPLQPSLPDRDNPSFGGPEPSEMLDAGQWLWFADRITQGIPAEPTADMDARQRQQARSDLLQAAAALAEAGKFIPDGSDTVPREALWSELGQQVYEQQPGRFTRLRLAARQRTYRELADLFRP